MRMEIVKGLFEFLGRHRKSNWQRAACCKKVQSMPEAYIGFGVRTYVDSSKLTRDIARGLLDLSMI